MKNVRLTPPQIELLTDIATKPQMFVRSWGRWGKTARVLAGHGFAKIDPDHSPLSQDMVTITAAGRVEAIRRGLIPAPPEARETTVDSVPHPVTSPREEGEHPQ